MNEERSVFSQNIRNFRKSKKLTQMEFANMINASRSAVCAWEDGRSMPPIHRAKYRFKQVIGVDLAELYSYNLCLGEQVSAKLNVIEKTFNLEEDLFLKIQISLSALEASIDDIVEKLTVAKNEVSKLKSSLPKI